MNLLTCLILLVWAPTLWALEIIDPDALPQRELVQGFGYRYPTCNQKGFIFMVLSPVANAFLEREAKPSKKILEIGTGFIMP